MQCWVSKQSSIEQRPWLVLFGLSGSLNYLYHFILTLTSHMCTVTPVGRPHTPLAVWQAHSLQNNMPRLVLVSHTISHTLTLALDRNCRARLNWDKIHWCLVIIFLLLANVNLCLARRKIKASRAERKHFSVQNCVCVVYGFINLDFVNKCTLNQDLSVSGRIQNREYEGNMHWNMAVLCG